MIDVDMWFCQTLLGNETVKSAVSSRVYDTARPDADEDADVVPYLMVTLEGGSAEGESKDDTRMCDWDAASVSVVCVAETRKALADLMGQVHTAIKEGLEAQDRETQGYMITDVSASAGAVQYDAWKPCFFQSVTYQCNID